MTLSKEFARYIEVRAKMAMPAPWDISTQEFREMTLPNLDFIGEPESIFSIENRIIAGPTTYLPIRIYRPSSEPNLPVLIYFHGGGWVIGNMDGSEPTVRSLANKGNFVVVQVQYQKAPEHQFPIPFDDCYATLEWVIANSGSLGIDPTKIGVGGDSAGGNLAAGVALKCRDEKLAALAFQMLVYPCTGHDSELPSFVRNAEGYGLTASMMQWYVKQYIGSERDLTNPYAFPAMSHNLQGVAPTILVTAEYDPLADDGRKYAQALSEAGVPVIFKEYEGAIHGFNALAGVSDIAGEVQHFLADGINELMGRR